MELTNQQIINKVNQWQNAGFVHPMNCRKNSLHQSLIPEERDNKVVLVCRDCDYVQNWIPEGVLLSDYVERIQEELRKTIPEEIRKLLKGTKLTTEESIVEFWNRPHPMLGGDTPQIEWHKGNRELVIAFVHMLKSGDGSMT